MSPSSITWDIGSAYDLFVSLEVLHHPVEFDVRSTWAAGVRARIPGEYRYVLEQSLILFHVPFSWIINLPGPKNGEAVLKSLQEIEPAKRLPALAFESYWPNEYIQIMNRVGRESKWKDDDVERLGSIHRLVSRHQEKKPPSPQTIIQILDWWTRSDEFGERYLKALEVYYDVFFSREERRIQSALQNSLSNAKHRSSILSLADLLEELSQGLRFEELNETEDIVLAPSYWSTPLVYFSKLPDDRSIFLFGARPATDPMVPGEAIPDALFRVLKSLSDLTRLQIMQYLTEQPLSPTQLANRLRLRLPTIVHH